METVSKVNVSGIFIKVRLETNYKLPYQPGVYLIMGEKGYLLSDFTALRVFRKIALVKY
jgi:hypothetical protein